jgi:hypothetical protein
LGFLLVGGANAAPVTINTNDGLVDPNWPTPRYISSSDNPAIPNALEIKTGYLASNPDRIYFRIQTYAAPASPTGYTAVAGIDCNNDNNTNDPYDRLIGYAPTGDYVWVADGTGSLIGSPGVQYGERVPASPNNDNLEWQLYFGAGSGLPISVFPDACRGAINVQFAITTFPGGVVQDQTGLYPWNIPTALDMEEFSATSGGSSRNIDLLILVGFLVISGIGTCMFAVWQRR